MDFSGVRRKVFGMLSEEHFEAVGAARNDG